MNGDDFLQFIRRTNHRCYQEELQSNLYERDGIFTASDGEMGEETGKSLETAKNDNWKLKLGISTKTEMAMYSWV